MEKLKRKMIETYRKMGDKKGLVSGRNSYTGNQVADEIEKESEIGIKLLNSIIGLTIDLLSRDKLNMPVRKDTKFGDIAYFTLLKLQDQLKYVDYHRLNLPSYQKLVNEVYLMVEKIHAQEKLDRK